MNNNLSYVVTLTAQKTATLQEVMRELEELKLFVQNGADFDIRLGGDAIKNLKKQIRDSIKGTLMELEAEGFKGGRSGNPKVPNPGSSLAPGLSDGITELSAAVRDLTRMMQTGNWGGNDGGGGGRRRQSLPGQSHLFGANSAMTGVYNTLQETGKVNVTDIKNVAKRMDDAARNLKDVDTGSLRPLLKQIEEMVQRQPSFQKSNPQGQSVYDLQLRTLFERAFEEQMRVVATVMNRNTPFKSGTGGSGGGSIDYVQLGREIGRGMSEALKTAPPAKNSVVADILGEMPYRHTPVTDTEAGGYTSSVKRSKFSELLAMRDQKKIAMEQAQRTGLKEEEKAARQALDDLERALQDTATDVQSGFGSYTADYGTRVMRNRNSVTAKSFVKGQRWYENLANADKNLVETSANADFVALPGVDQRVINKLLTGLVSAPLGMFGNEKEPRKAQERFSELLRNEIVRMDTYLQDNLSEGGAVIPPIAADRISVLFREARKSELRRGAGLPEQDYDAAIRDVFTQIPALKQFAQDPETGEPFSMYAGYQAMINPINFYAGHGRARPSGSRQMMSPEDRPTDGDEALFGWSPRSLDRDLEEGRIDMSTYDLRWAAMKETSQLNGLKFYESTADREYGLFKQLRQVEELKKQYDPEEAPEVLQSLETARRQFAVELYQGGIWGNENDPFIQKRGRRVGDLDQILTDKQLAALEGPIAQGTMTLDAGFFPRYSGKYFGADGGLRRDHPDGIGMEPPDLGGPGGMGFGGKGPVPVIVKNFSEMGNIGLGENTTGTLNQVLESLKNTAAMIRQSGIVDKGPNSKMAGVTAELDAKLRYKEALGQIEVATKRGKLEVTREARESRARQEAIDMFEQVSAQRGGAEVSKIKLRGELPATGIDREAYRSDEGLFLRDLRQLVGTFRRANQRAADGLIARELSDSDAGWVRGNTRMMGGRFDAEMSQVQMAQLMLTRAGPGGDEAINANANVLREFLRTAEQALGIRQIAGVAAQGGAVEAEIKKELAMKQGQAQAYGAADNRIREIEKRMQAVREYEGLSKSIELRGATASDMEANFKGSGLADLPDKIRTSLVGGSVNRRRAEQRLLEILNKEGEGLGLGKDKSSILELLKPTDPTRANNPTAFDLDRVIARVQELVNERMSVPGTLRADNAVELRRLAELRRQFPEINQQSYGDLDRERTLAIRDRTSVFGQKDSAKEAAALAQANRAVAELKTKLSAASQETIERVKQVAQTLGVTFESVDDLINKKLPEVESRLAALGKVVTKTATTETQSGARGPSRGIGAGLLENLARKTLQLGQYVAAGGIVYSATNAIRATFAEMTQFESEMRRIQGVLASNSPVQRDQIGRAVQGSALEYGTDLTQSLRAARVYAQIGASPDEIGELTRATLAAQQGAGFEGNQASEFLIAARTISSGNVLPFDILDRVAAIEARYAVTAQDLAQAVQRVGSLVNQFQGESLGGVDAFDTIIGATTAIVEATRISGNQAATALRFVLSRIASPDVANQLQREFGIKLAGETPNELRPLQDILADIAKKYESLKASGNTVDASRLLVTFAGARQANIGAALLGNFGRVQDVAAESAYSFGDSQARAELQLDTVAGRLQQVNTSFFALANNVTQTSEAMTIFKWLLKQLAEVLQDIGEKGGTAGGLAAAAGLGYALKRGGAAGVAATGARAATSLTQLGGIVSGGVGVLGATMLGTAALTAGIQGYRYVADQNNLPGSRYRVRDLDTDSQQEQYQDQLRSLAERFSTSGSQLVDIAGAAGRNIKAAVEERYGEGAYNRLLNGNLVDSQVTNTVNKAVLETFEGSLEGFKSAGTETERLNMAFAALRLTTAGLNISVTALGKELTRISDEYNRSMGNTQDRAADLRGDLNRANLSEVLDRIDQLGRAPGLNFAPNLSSMMLYGGSIAERFRQTGYRDSSVLIDYNEPTASVLNQAFTADPAITSAYWTRFNSMREARLQQYAGQTLTPEQAERATPTSQEVLMRLEEERREKKLRPLTRSERDALSNQSLLYLNAREALAERYPQFDLAAPERPKDALERGVGAMDAPRRLAMENFIADAKRAGKSPEAAQQEALTRALENPGQRVSQLAALNTQTGASARIRALYLNPYIQYMQQQSDITNLTELGQYGPGFDYQSARADATRTLALNLGRVRGSMLSNTLQEVVQAGTQVQALSRADFVNVDMEGLSAETRKMIEGLPLTGEEGAGEANQKSLAATISRLSANENMLELYSTNFKQLFGQVEGMTPEQGAVGERMMKAFKEMTEGAPDAEKLRAFLLDSLQFSNTAAEAIRKAQQQYAREQKVIYEREQRRLDIVEQQGLKALSIQYQSGRGQLGVEGRAAAFSSINRQDLAFGAQRESFAIRRGEAAAIRELELETIRRNLGNDAANLRVGSDEYNKRLREQSLPVETQYRQAMQQAALDEERAIQNERQRRQDQINQQSQSLSDGVFAPVKTLLTDFDALSRRGIPVIVEGLADTFQNLFAERAIDLLAGPNGMLTSGIRGVFTEASFQTNYAINSAFITGGETAAAAIRAALTGTGGPPTLGPIRGINEVVGSGGSAGVVSTVDGAMTITAAAGGATMGALLGDRAGKYLTDPRILPKPKVPGLSPEQVARMQNRQQRLAGAIALGQLGGSLGGAFLGGRVNPGEQTYASEGSSIGTALGSGIATMVGATGVGLVLAPLVGGLLGGLLGGSQKRKQEAQDPQLVALERIERNTRQQIDAIENQTQLLKPDSRFLNVPAGFLVPSFRPGSAGSFGDININVYGGGQDSRALADQVAKALKSELNIRGGSFDVRNM